MATGEVYTWREGKVTFYTGAPTAVVAYARNSTLRAMFGYATWTTLDGVYHTKMTGQRYDLQIEALYCQDVKPLWQLFSSTAQVHVHLLQWQGGTLPSAGHKLWSGRITDMEYAGSEGQQYTFRLSYFSHEATAY